MLINAYNVLANLKAWRVLWLDGHQGGGKTSLAFRLAYELLIQGEVKYLTSNIPNVWNTKPEYIPMNEQVLNTACIIDEGGFTIKTKNEADQYMTALRKLNVYLIVPSRRAPASDVCAFRIQRVIDLRTVGINAWFYNYQIKDGFQKDNGWFIWWNPSEIYGIYDTDKFPITDGGIGYALEDAIEKITVETSEERTRFNQFKRRNVGNTILQLDETLEGFSSIISQAEDVSRELSVSVQKVQKRRRI
jgi:hypothetical protein